MCAGSQVSSGAEDISVQDIQSGQARARQTNRFVRHTFREQDTARYADAVDAYLRLLTRSPEGLSEEGQDIVACHRRQLALILPDRLRRRVHQSENGGSASLAQSLDRWWRAQDPYPASAFNERAQQHLLRVAEAVARYPNPKSPTGIDHRGEVLIRLGLPDRTTQIRFQGPRVLSIIRNSPILTRGDFPENEYWVYPTIHKEARYLFVKDGGEWKIGTSLDLIPSVVMSRMGAGGRGGRAGKLGVIFEEIYSQLATIDIDYSGLYQAAKSATATTLTGSNEDVSRMRQFLAESRGFERRRASDREEAVPDSYSELSTQEALGIETRVSRFLTEEGSTRTAVDWGLPAARIGPVGSDNQTSRVLDVTTVQYDAQYRVRASERRRYRVQLEEAPQAVPGMVRQVRAGTTTEVPYHIAVQWDRRPVDGNNVGSVEERHVVRVDSLRPLHAEPSQFEMSDLRLMTLPGGSGSSDNAVFERAQPYPFSTAAWQTPLLLYFELYGLRQDNQGQSQYTVTYEVTRTVDRGFFGRLFGDKRETVTSTTTEYAGQRSRTEEYIMLDLGEGGSKPRSATITVRVTDDVTGRQAEREVDLELVPSSGQSPSP